MKRRESNKQLALDQVDLRILECLQNNARISNVELSQRVHLSATQCWRRIRNLEQSGLITGYLTKLDREALGLGVLAFASITFDKAQHRKLADLLRVIDDCPEVLECYAVTGDYDYLLKIVVPDLKAYELFLNQKLMRGPGITSVRSVVCLSVVKASTALPINS